MSRSIRYLFPLACLMLLENEVVVVGYQESIAINPRKMLSLATSPLSIQ